MAKPAPYRIIHESGSVTHLSASLFRYHIQQGNLIQTARKEAKLQKGVVCVSGDADRSGPTYAKRAVETVQDEVVTCTKCFNDFPRGFCRSIKYQYVCRTCNPPETLKYLRRHAVMPGWADRAAIRAIYQRARELTITTGITHHVDHIIPVKSPIVCGLHVETNLQILIGTDNIRKGNKFDCEREIATLESYSPQPTSGSTRRDD